MALPVLFSSPASAQEAYVTGSVRAQGGAAVSGVTVLETTSGASGSSDEAGRFSLEVPSGRPLTLRLSHPGFVGERLELDPLDPGATRRIALTLAQLYSLDAVAVTTPRQRPLLNTSDGETGGTIEGRELTALPVDARDPLRLAFQVPGVAQSTGFFGDAPPLTIGGGNALYTQYSVDGFDNNEGFLGGPRVDLPLAAISRLSVLTSTYSVLHGRSPDGLVVAQTRSGSDRWTGETFVFGRPGVPLDASPRFTPAGVDPDGFRRFQLGGSAGGPLRVGRTFLFGAAEYSNEREDRIGSTARTDFLGSELRETWKLFGRLDHGWSDAQTTTVRFALSDVNRAGQGGGVIVPEADITTRRVGSLLNATHSTTFADGTASNRFTALLGTFHWDFPPTRSSLDIPQVTIVSPDLVTVEAVVGSSNYVFDERETQLQLRNVFEARIGERHTIRLGGDVVASRFELSAASTGPRGSYTVVNEGNIVATGALPSIRNIPADVRVLRYTIDARPQQVDLTQTLWSAFVEDSWRATPRLTLNLGLRWDYDDITSRGESDPDLDNFQPRGSFNWLAGPTSVIRGGLGLYTGKLPYAVYSDAVQFGPEGNAVLTFEGEDHPPPAFGAGPDASELDPASRPFSPREIRRLFARGLEQPYSVQAALGYQYDYREEWGFSVDGIWIETYDLPRSWDLNAITRPLTAADTVHRSVGWGDQWRPVTPVSNSYRRLTTTDTGGRARHLALHINGRRRVTQRLAMEGSYVLSRSRNDTEDINFNATSGNDFAAEWADGINDRRHHVTIRGILEPVRRARLAVVADYQTGSPINRVAHFRDLDGSGPIYGEGFVGNYDRFPGVRRNAERLPDAFLLNGSAAFVIPSGGGQIELGLEVFNALNSRLVSGFANGIPGGGPRTQVGRPGDPITYTNGGPSRQFQLSLRWLW